MSLSQEKRLPAHQILRLPEPVHGQTRNVNICGPNGNIGCIVYDTYISFQPWVPGEHTVTYTVGNERAQHVVLIDVPH